MQFGDNFFSDIFSTNLTTSCKWLPANQFLFQLANIFLVFTYFAQPNGLSGLVQLRVALTLAGLCFGIWGGTVICSFDCMLWNSAFAVGNALHLLYLFVKLKPKRFEHDHETIYETIFQPVGVKRFQYHKLVKITNVSKFTKGEYYAIQGTTESDHIGILVYGSFEVLLEGRSLSHINQYEFLDSPEWLSMRQDVQTKCQASLVANEDSKVFQWERKQLVKLFKNDSIIKNIFDSLIGKDICKKLFSLHQTFLMQDEPVISEQLKQAPLLTYSAANLHLSTNNIPLVMYSPCNPRSPQHSNHSQCNNQEPHAITVDNHDFLSINDYSSQQHQRQDIHNLHEQLHQADKEILHQLHPQENLQQQQQQNGDLTELNFKEDRVSNISRHSNNEKSVHLFSSSSRRLHNDDYSLLETTSDSHGDKRDNSNEEISFVKPKHQSEDKEFLFRETDL